MNSKRLAAFALAAIVTVGIASIAEAQEVVTPSTGSSARQASELDGPPVLPAAEMPSLASTLRWSLSWVWLQVPGLQPTQLPFAAHTASAVLPGRRSRVR